MPQFLKYTVANAAELAKQFDIKSSVGTPSKKSVKILKEGVTTPSNTFGARGPGLMKKLALKGSSGVVDDDDAPKKKSDPFKDLTNDSEDGLEFADQRKARYVKSYT